ncbi:MAG: HlyC/CorC family transporter [Selenomonadaceae bacterium]|nr:HlyC/CorC family transporter [Selenomonadaceae bacterium]
MDSPHIGLWLALTAGLIFGHGFFSLLETSLTESHRGRLEKLADEGDKQAAAALELLERSEEHLAVMQLGITCMGISAGVCAVMLATEIWRAGFPLGQAPVLAASFLIMTALVLLLGEFVPKKSAREQPEKNLMKHHCFISRATWVTRPLTAALSYAADSLLLALGLNPAYEDTVTEDEVKDLIEQGTEDGTFEKSEQAMVDRIFHMGDQTAYALMTPRTQMLWLDLADSTRHNLRLIHEHPQTVFPVGRESLDDFCGVIYVKDLLNAMLKRRPLDLDQYVRKPMFIPRSMETLRLLEKFRDTGVHEAMVQDEYGGVVGFITLNDILREIIGDSMSSLDATALQITARDENSWYVDGLYPIDDFKARFGLDTLPDEERDHFQTMGGFLTSYFGYIPKVGETCRWRDFEFTVVDMDRARIDKILLLKG